MTTIVILNCRKPKRSDLIRPFLVLALLFTTILIPVCSLSQSVLGIVVDEEHKPVELAYVTVNDSLNLITNKSGEFLIKNGWGIHDINLNIQMLGYFPKAFALTLVSDTSITFHLIPAPIILNEVSVIGDRQKSYKASEIVQIAIDSLNAHLSSDPSCIEGFYTQNHYSQSVKNQNGLMPVLDSIKTYQRIIKSNVSVFYNAAERIPIVKINQLKRSNDYRLYSYGYPSGKGSSFSVKYVSITNPIERDRAIQREKGLYDLSEFLQLNPISNYRSQVTPSEKLYLASGSYGYLNEDFLKKHTVKLDGIIDYEDKKVFKIKILPSKRSYKHGFLSKHHWIPVGYIYIKSGDFSIVRMDYSYIVNPKKKNFNATLTKAVAGTSVLFRDVILYKEVNGKMELAYLSRFQQDIDAGHTEGFRKYYYMEREFVATKYYHKEIPSDDNHAISSIYDPYIYDAKYWLNVETKYIDKEKREKIASDLENEGEKLEDQFKKNSEN